VNIASRTRSDDGADPRTDCLHGQELARPDPSAHARDRRASETYGKFSCEPLERGFGTTLGVALRRVLLSSLQGAAISHIAIEGALHEFTSLPGVVEDVTDIILNLKETLFKVEADKTYTIRLDKQGEGVGHWQGPDARRRRHLPQPPPPHLHAVEGRQGRDGADDHHRPRLQPGRAPLRGPAGRHHRDRRAVLADPQGQLHRHQRSRRSADGLRQAHARSVDQRRRPPGRRRGVRCQDPQGAAQPVHQLRGDGRADRGSARRGAGEAQREPVAHRRRARAVGALGQLPPERQHQVHRRAGAEDRVRDAQDQELRPQVAQGDQGDPRRDGPVSSA
jgi:hypothetical protein